MPIAAPSVNRSGHVSPTHAAHVLDDLHGRIPLILDAGPTTTGLESTVVDLTTPTPTLLRPGTITKEQLQAVLGQMAESTDSRRSPGLRYRHYAPQKPVRLFTGAGALAQLEARLGKQAQAHTIGIIHHSPLTTTATTYQLPGDPAGAAHELYHALRTLDANPTVKEIWG